MSRGVRSILSDLSGRGAGWLAAAALLLSTGSTARADLVEGSQLRPLTERDAPYQIDSSLRAHLNLKADAEALVFKDAPGKVLLVFQETFGLLDPEDPDHRYIGSIDAYPCINVALLDEARRRVALGHFDGKTQDDAAVQAMISRFPDGAFSPSRAVLASETGPSPKHLEALIRALVSRGIPRIDYLKSNSLIVSPGGEVFTNLVRTAESEAAGYTRKAGLVSLPGADCALQKDIVGRRGLAEGCAAP
jgi:hypothetical protein